MPKIRFEIEEFEPLIIEFKGKDYQVREITGELIEELKPLREAAAMGDLSAFAQQLSIVTGIPHEELNKLNKIQLDEMNEMLIEESNKLKKKEKELKKSAK